MNYKLKIITGYRDDQEYTIDADEAHKAYYLFFNQEQRGVFKNGLALRGSDIHSIVPDWHSTMGWYKSHKLGSDDWAELRQKGVENKIKEIMYDAQTLAKIPASVQLSLEEAKSKYLLS